VTCPKCKTTSIIAKGNLDIDIQGIESNSQKVKENFLFVAIKGFVTDGHKYIENAIENGAIAIAVEEGFDLKSVKIPENIAIIMSKNNRELLAISSCNFYNNPSKKFKLIGVTGTKGKTTTTFMIKEILEKAGKKVGLIGTIATYINGERKEDSDRTTPESLELQRLFAQMNEEDLYGTEDATEATEEGAVDEGTNVTLPNGRKKSKSHTPAGKKGANTKHHDSQAGKYEAEKIDEIVNENKVLKNAVAKLRKDLREAYVTNVNLGKITKLFLENTTSQKEKIDIVNRFVNEAKTVEQSNALYESINKELKKNSSNVSSAITEATMKVEKAPLNETKIYESDDFKQMRDLMNRVISC